MPRWRPPDLTRLFVGQHVGNGVSVGVGVITVALAADALFGFAAGQPEHAPQSLTAPQVGGVKRFCQ